MSKITIVIEDIVDEKGAGIKLKLSSQPPFSPEDKNLSKAQQVALEAVKFISSQASSAESSKKINVKVIQENGKFLIKLPMLEVSADTEEACVNLLLEKLKISINDINLER